MGSAFFIANCEHNVARFRGRKLSGGSGCGRNKLNFMLHLDLMPYCGVDITHTIASDSPKEKVAEMPPADDIELKEWDESML